MSACLLLAYYCNFLTLRFYFEIKHFHFQEKTCLFANVIIVIALNMHYLYK